MRRALPVVVALGALAACADEPAEGRMEVTVYGGPLVEESIPTSAFADGWSVTYSKFLVSVGYYVKLEDPGGAIELSLIDPSVFDLAQPSNGLGHVYDSERRIAPGTYNHVDWRIAAPLGARAENVDQAIVDEMKRAHHTVRVMGTATRGAESFTFDWGFEWGVDHEWCALEEEWVIDGNTVAVRLDIAGQRLFQTDLVTNNPRLEFDPITVADGIGGVPRDGVITQDELENANLSWTLTERLGLMGGVNGRPCDDVSVVPGL